MHRTQLYFTQDQFDSLRQEAFEKKTTVSAILRQKVDNYISKDKKKRKLASK